VAQVGDGGRICVGVQSGQKRIVVQLLGIGADGGLAGHTEKAFRIEWLQNGAAIRLLPQAVQPNGIETLEDVPVFAMLGQAAMLFDKALDVLEPGNDPLFAGRASA